MPRYKVKPGQKGFAAGTLYEAGGKRPILHRAEPYPSSTKGLKKGQKAVEQVPSWLERMPDESPATEKARKAAETKAQKAADKKAAEDAQEIADVTFTKVDGSKVETLG